MIFFTSSRGVSSIVLLSFIVILGAFFYFLYNPIERNKFRQDSQMQAISTQLIDGLSKYFGIHNRFPWEGNVVSNGRSLNWIDSRDSIVGVCDNSTCTKPGFLINQGYLSTDFYQNELKTLYVGRNAGKVKVFACFLPSSRSVRKNTGSLYKLDIEKPVPSTLSSCPSTVTWSDTDVCYSCTE